LKFRGLVARQKPSQLDRRNELETPCNSRREVETEWVTYGKDTRCKGKESVNGGTWPLVAHGSGNVTWRT